MSDWTFSIPDGMDVPKDTKPGDTFSVMADVKLNEDGTLTIVALDGHDLPPEDEKAEDTAAPEAGGPDDQGGYVAAVGKGMSAMGMK